MSGIQPDADSATQGRENAGLACSPQADSSILLGKCEIQRSNFTFRHLDHAFVPDPLPSRVDLRAETVAVIESAAMELGILEGAATQFESPYLITRPSIRREAVSTSALEGTFSTLEDLYAAGLATVESEDAALREVSNYVAAAEYGVQQLSTRPVSLNLVCDLHRILLTGTQHAGPAGKLRTGQVAIGSYGAPITEARFVPPPPGAGLEALFSGWEKWNYAQDPVPLMARIAVSHYQFETIHPFMDGNGRIGRLVAILLLIELGPLSDHYMVLSPYLEARRSRYVELLAETTATGDFDGWIRFFAEAVRAEAQAARRRMKAVVEYKAEIVQRLRSEGLKGAVISLAESLVAEPVVTPRSAALRLDVSLQTAYRVIDKLVAASILEEVTGRSYGRLFMSPDVFRILRS